MAKILVTYFSTALELTFKAATIPLFERPSAISRSTSSSRGGEPVDRVGAAAHEKLRDDFGIEGRAAGRHPAHRVEEISHLRDPVLEEIPDRGGAHRQQAGGVAPGRCCRRSS